MKLFFFVFMACSAYLATAVIVSQTVTPTLSRPVRELSKSSLQTTNGEIRILPRKVPKSKVPLSDIHIKKTKDTALQAHFGQLPTRPQQEVTEIRLFILLMSETVSLIILNTRSGRTDIIWHQMKVMLESGRSTAQKCLWVKLQLTKKR